MSGAIKSQEDHGYTVDLGVANLTGFCTTPDRDLPLGQCALFKVSSKSNKRTIGLTHCDSTKESCFHTIEKRHLFDTYLPGAQLQCSVERKAKNGYQLTISNQLIAYVHANHLPIAKREAFLGASKKNVENPHALSNGDKVKATLVFVNPYSKIVYVSLLPHLVDSTKLPKTSRLFSHGEEDLKLGQVIDNAQVAMHTHKGLFIKFKGANKKIVTGFIPKKHLFERMADQEEEEQDDDEDAKKNAKKDAKNMNTEELEALFPLKSNIHARIYDFSLIEDMILLSHRKSVIKTRYLFYNDLKIGQVRFSFYLVHMRFSCFYSRV